MKRILITGVSGFVGVNLVRHFSGQPGYQLYGHSRDRARARQQFGNDKIEMVNEVSASLLDTMPIDGIIHLAGIAHDLDNRFQPEDYDKVNFECTKKVFDAFLESSASIFIFLSSIKAAVDISNEPVSEEVVPHPVTPYGKSKLKAEQYIQSRLRADKRVFIFRPCMMHGPGNKGNLNLLYRFVKTGIPFPFGAFENKRSFLSIDNFTFITRQFLQNEMQPGVYHLADDGFISTRELVVLIATALGKRPRIWNVPKGLIAAVAALAGKKHKLTKLTEDLVVSNGKLSGSLRGDLPVALEAGIIKTIKSFRG
jgi:nucleoside-diphosphate-sugar epimerase